MELNLDKNDILRQLLGRTVRTQRHNEPVFVLCVNMRDKKVKTGDGNWHKMEDFEKKFKIPHRLKYKFTTREKVSKLSLSELNNEVDHGIRNSKDTAYKF